MTVATVEDLAVEREIEAVRQNAELHGWPFERVGPRLFRVTLTARNGDTYQIEVECERLPREAGRISLAQPGIRPVG